MPLWLRRGLAVAGCALGLVGGSQAFRIAAAEPPPRTPVANTPKLEKALATEKKAAASLALTKREQASTASKMSLQIETLQSEIKTGTTLLASLSGQQARQSLTGTTSTPAVHTVTGASGGGEDGGSGGDN